jgi:hypothetical protein
MVLVFHPILVDLTVIAIAGTLYLGHGITCDIQGTMGFLKNRLRVKGLKFGSKISQTLGATVRSTTSIGKRVIIVLNFLS